MLPCMRPLPLDVPMYERLVLNRVKELQGSGGTECDVQPLPPVKWDGGALALTVHHLGGDAQYNTASATKSNGTGERRLLLCTPVHA